MSLRSRRRRKLKRRVYGRRLKRRRPSFGPAVVTFTSGGGVVLGPTGGLLWAPASNSNSPYITSSASSTALVTWDTNATALYSIGATSATSVNFGTSSCWRAEDDSAYESFPAEDGVPTTYLRIPLSASDAEKTELREEHLRWRADYVQRQRETEERLRAENEERRAASARARSLLLSYMTDAQRESFEKDKKFDVLAPSGNRYVLHDFMSANIDVLGPNGDLQHRLCVHIGEYGVPKEDTILVQKIMLENGMEEELTRLANKHAIRPTGAGAGGIQIAGGQALFVTSALTFVNPQNVVEGHRVAPHTEFTAVPA